MSDGKRLVVCGAVKVNGELVSDFLRELISGDVIEFRKQTFTHKE